MLTATMHTSYPDTGKLRYIDLRAGLEPDLVAEVQSQGCKVYIEGFKTYEQAKEVAATFPKYCKVKVSTCYGLDNKTRPILVFELGRPNSRVSGPVNEIGNKRLGGFLKVLGGMELEKQEWG